MKHETAASQGHRRSAQATNHSKSSSTQRQLAAHEEHLLAVLQPCMGLQDHYNSIESGAPKQKAASEAEKGRETELKETNGHQQPCCPAPALLLQSRRHGQPQRS